jgi:L-lysine 2,3-aminomutase
MFRRRVTICLEFVGNDNFKFATRESGTFQVYLQNHKQVSDVLITGGDPIVMQTRHLALYIEPLLSAEFEHIQTIRIGTKAASNKKNT